MATVWRAVLSVDKIKLIYSTPLNGHVMQNYLTPALDRKNAFGHSSDTAE
jgi:hypothetical protein